MTSTHYEQLLADYSNRQHLIDLFRQFRPYLELLPSLRRPDESIISIPLPLVRLRDAMPVSSHEAGRFSAGDLVRLPCDIGVVMCDPKWKIKIGVDVFVFIHRPQEDFSALLSRWRQTQIWIDRGYDWLMPTRYQHIFSEGAAQVYPLFVLTDDAPDHTAQGLRGAALPFIDVSVRRSADGNVASPDEDGLRQSRADGPADSRPNGPDASFEA